MLVSTQNGCPHCAQIPPWSKSPLRPMAKVSPPPWQCQLQLCGEVSGAGAFAQLRLGMCQGNYGKPGRYWSSPQSATLCALPQERASIHVFFTGRLPTAPLFIPAALQPKKGLAFPGLDARTAMPGVWLEPLTPQGRSPCSSRSLPRSTGPSLTPSLPFLSDFMAVFFYSLGCSISVSFQ